jgi:hypothetical protein
VQFPPLSVPAAAAAAAAVEAADGAEAGDDEDEGDRDRDVQPTAAKVTETKFQQTDKFKCMGGTVERGLDLGLKVQNGTNGNRLESLFRLSSYELEKDKGYSKELDIP